jgi:hypothetical protein
VATVERLEPPPRLMPLLVAGTGVVALAVTLPLGPKAMLGGSLVLLLASAIAVREARAPVVTWANALAVLFSVFWLIPMKTYGLPVTLPFQLEPYRLFLFLLFVCWAGAVLLGKVRIAAARHSGPLVLLFLSAVLSLVFNYRALADLSTTETEVLKPLTFFVGFLFVFLLVASTTSSLPAIDRLVRTLVAGGVIVAVAAVYESSTAYNVFDHLNEWFPFLEKQERELDSARAGRARVYASSQHPIALGCALTMMVPLAVYLADRARSKARTALWLGAGLALATAAFTTISRTIVVMGIVMLLAWLVVRRNQIKRFWPALLALPFVVHVAAPGAMGGIWKAFFPEEGLVSSLGGREGEGGSGRFADYGIARALWDQSPVVGNGPGAIGYIPVEAQRRVDQGLEAVTTASNLIFDNQLLSTLVEFGTLGLVALLWFSLGATLKLGRTALRERSPAGDLVAVCAVSCAGFTASMFLYDAFAFIQATLVFFVLAALGLRARALVLEREEARRGPEPTSPAA